MTLIQWNLYISKSHGPAQKVELPKMSVTDYFIKTDEKVIK